MAGFCHNSRVWLDFLFENPKSCPYEKDGSECETHCGYYEDRVPTKWYKRKLQILRSYREIENE